MRQRPEPGSPILVDIADGVYELKFPLKILRLLKEEQEINVLRGAGMEGVFTDPEKLATLVYYGLRTKNEGVTLEWVEDNIDASMLLNLAPLLAYATTGRWPKMTALEDGEDIPNAERESRLRGSPYGQSDDTTSVSVSANSGE